MPAGARVPTTGSARPARRAAHHRASDIDPAALISVLADIAARLTEARPRELVAQDVLESACAALGATECTVLLDGPSGLARSWSAGNDASGSTGPAEPMPVSYGLPGGSGAITADMRFGPRRIGILAVRLHRGSTEPPETAEPVQRFVAALASLLAAFVAHSDRSSRLESDLQKRMVEAEEQKRFGDMILDLLPLGLYVIDREYRITVWNRKREIGSQGVSREHAIGQPVFDILHRQPADVLRREFDEVFATGRMQQFQMESRSTGSLRTYRLSKIPMRGPSGDVTHVITIGEDITDWVEARERVAQNEKLAAIGRLAAGIMHEINNPLATIAACAESMSLENAPIENAPLENAPIESASVESALVQSASGAPEYLTIIGSEVQRCKRIVDGLLDFSRPRPLERQLLDLNGVVDRTLFLLKHHARFKQLTVRADLAPDLPGVSASAEQLIQVIIALLMNAADAMPQYGVVEIRTRAGVSGGERHATLEVQDEGCGISRAQMARIFEPFYTTKEPGVGTGLGLSICHGIVADHGGRMEVESSEGRGTTFRITLPAGSA